MKCERLFAIGRRGLWLALASCVIGGSACGQGTIVYGRLPLNIVPPVLRWDADGYRLMGYRQTVTLPLDLNGDGTIDYTFRSWPDFDVYGAGENAVMARRSTPNDLNGLAIALGDGWSIGPDPQPYQWIGTTVLPSGSIGSALSACRDIGCIGYFVGVVSACAGLRFDISGESHYGWVRVGAPWPELNGGYIYDYAYETRPDVPIKAGAQPVPVPLRPARVVRAGYLRLKWRSEIGKAYQVQTKARLAAFAWSNLSFVIPATSTNSKVDVPMSAPAQFFRVVEAD